jgi:hypothetical protein
MQFCISGSCVYGECRIMYACRGEGMSSGLNMKRGGKAGSSVVPVFYRVTWKAFPKTRQKNKKPTLKGELYILKSDSTGNLAATEATSTNIYVTG